MLFGLLEYLDDLLADEVVERVPRENPLNLFVLRHIFDCGAYLLTYFVQASFPAFCAVLSTDQPVLSDVHEEI